MSNSGEIVSRTDSALVQFNPQEAKERVSAIDAAIAHAKRIKDWPALERAVDLKIEEQSDFIRWWEANVTANRGARTDLNADLRLSLDDAEKQTQIKQQQVSRWRKRLEEKEKYRAQLFGAAYRKFWGGEADDTAHVSRNSGENEWYTPPEYIESARAVMGDIDLDPASSEIAQQCVNAGEFFTKDDDGLACEWYGRVWLNPPYAQPLISQFCDKLLQEFSCGNVEQACVLVNNATETKWLQSLLHISSAVCFPSGRVRFLDADGNPGAPLQGQAVVYFGPNQTDFARQFKLFGVVFLASHLL